MGGLEYLLPLGAVQVRSQTRLNLCAASGEHPPLAGCQLDANV